MALHEFQEGSEELVGRPGSDEDDAEVASAGTEMLLVFSLEVAGVPRADGAALPATPLHEVPVVLTGKTTVTDTSDVEAEFGQSVRDGRG